MVGVICEIIHVVMVGVICEIVHVVLRGRHDDGVNARCRVQLWEICVIYLLFVFDWSTDGCR